VRCKYSTCAAVRPDRRRCAQRRRLSDPTDAADGFESARAPRRSAGGEYGLTATGPHVAGVRSTSCARTINKRASCLQSRSSTGIGTSPVRASSTCCFFHPNTRCFRRLCSLLCDRCACAVESGVQQQLLNSRTAASTAQKPTCAAVLRDRRASACSLVAIRTEVASLASIAQAFALHDREAAADVSITMAPLLQALPPHLLSDKPRSSILGNAQPEGGTPTAKTDADADYRGSRRRRQLGAARGARERTARSNAKTSRQ
jgi:hypothetical protein